MSLINRVLIHDHTASLSSSSSSYFSIGGLAGLLGIGNFLTWLLKNVALSLSFLLTNTESIFFRFGNIDIMKHLKFMTSVSGFP